ncbi:monovalent cation/H+ antiporter subunit D [Sphingomonas koreensis]|jgi:multicomponent K+:H+ antiporter subunit D|uniref:monovalent cation/H+ antiporter subunit D n=2 Tax=Sphingomonadales TaxID=204457 RepID=UPI00051F6BBD|nr:MULTISPECIES: monovalent cation/H+ antiporter subunit D [Sphingomonadaceae]AIT82514.1 monovalent cation/H+ antiporter subunit D [Novosphingobium pentaromativorans US6-1]KKC23904.1 monovalent cation/H+ antiporter subunit D [Sphingomonas sp. SRS2]RSU74508.1 monovalent cation/H+ antiporter subunit D [Sphingomonas koreensis]RSV52742.1 monovalent cation/H+ antiporter subunit D [Sphingomonas koreensis]RSX22354.1 monovalent cation/H+ antiporter subunit D [Sphingomonas koreensis]
MTGWMQHFIIAPIVLPMAVSAVMLAFNERRRALKRVLSLTTMAGLVVIAALLLWQADGRLAIGDTGPAGAYLLGNWPAPFGIVLVADRLAALMLLVTSVLGFTALFYALARWDRSGPRFHVLFLLLVAGVNGAFLTGDIFNLFVFFEVLLAASYGLILHGSGAERTKASLHYITINIATSLLFLIGVAIIYAVTGTLNMADLASRIPMVPASDLMLLEAGAAILGVAFLVKSGIWPLSFWLPRTYAAAAPPVAAIFAIMTKVGIYIVLRLTSLMFDDTSGDAAGFADQWLIWAGFATMLFGTLGILATRSLTHVAGHYVLVSSGTLLAAIGLGGQALTAALLFYLVSSTLAVGALYLIIEPVERNADEEDIIAGIAEPVFDDEYTGAVVGEETEIGVVIPGTIAILGGGFIFCTLLLAGLPPLSGFIAKFAIIDALFDDVIIEPAAWILIALIILSGLATLIAMTRAGIDLLWTPGEDSPARLSVIEVAPIGVLLAACLALMVGAGPLYRYMEATAAALADRSSYIDIVRSAPRAGEDPS